MKLNKYRIQQLSYMYGLSEYDYWEIFNDQNGRCGICGCELNNGFSTHIDHDHSTGCIRGLLCSKCNHCIGNADDDPIILNKAIRWIEADQTNMRKIPVRQIVCKESVVADFRAGLSVADIAIKQNISKAWVVQILRKKGITTIVCKESVVADFRAGLSVADIAIKYDITKVWVNRILRKKGVR